jgi:hypothetical protein
VNSDRFKHWNRHALIVIPRLDSLSGHELEFVNERAGIREFDGGQAREVAESEALVDFAYFRAGKERK